MTAMNVEVRHLAAPLSGARESALGIVIHERLQFVERRWVLRETVNGGSIRPRHLFVCHQFNEGLERRGFVQHRCAQVDPLVRSPNL